MTGTASGLRKNFSSGSSWEDAVGYSRAVRVGNRIYVSGTTAVDESGAIVGVQDAGAQTGFIIAKIETALQACGAALDDVVRTRMFVTDIEDWPSIGAAHNDAFADIRPAVTMVEVSRLIDPGLLVEIEIDAEIAG